MLVRYARSMDDSDVAALFALLVAMLMWAAAEWRAWRTWRHVERVEREREVERERSEARARDLERQLADRSGVVSASEHRAVVERIARYKARLQAAAVERDRYRAWANEVNDRVGVTTQPGWERAAGALRRLSEAVDEDNDNDATGDSVA